MKRRETASGRAINWPHDYTWNRQEIRKKSIQTLRFSELMSGTLKIQFGATFLPKKLEL